VAAINRITRALARRRDASLVLLGLLAGPALTWPARAEEPEEPRVRSALAEARAAAQGLTEEIRGLLMRVPSLSARRRRR